MITAREAKEITAAKNSINRSKHYLATLNTLIKKAADDGKYSLIIEWHEKITPQTFREVRQVLVNNGYSVQTIPSSHYYEYGGIKVSWI